MATAGGATLLEELPGGEATPTNVIEAAACCIAGLEEARCSPTASPSSWAPAVWTSKAEAYVLYSSWEAAVVAAALQAFLQHRSVSSVVAVELVVSRHAEAVLAARRLCEASGGQLTYEEVGDGSEGNGVSYPAVARILESDGFEMRSCELRLGDILDTPVRDLARAEAVMLEVVMPPLGRSATSSRDACDQAYAPAARARAKLCEMLAGHCRQGCVVVTYEDLHSLWRALPSRLAPSCPFHRLENCEEKFATSWNPCGHRLHSFICDRDQPPCFEFGMWL
eukprot:CAMPEP_0117589344 /NCGR_PEP_ID=MMETSP0784-20121206/70361_1 /TAXON_ID=39447 /ORGANISM="" /LENGTH=280 /DNA_ID=CAMNT_0005390817 /DNA_START=48 /DNA_END=889 /DNA_ORIENTATION=+